MKYLAVDYGQTRTGLAVSDPDGRMAFPLRTIVKETRAEFFAELLHCLEQESAEAVVVGLPLSMDGTESLSTRQVRNFVARLRRRTSLPVYLMNEQLSTCEAEEDLRSAGLRGERLRQVLDQQAAVRILESFLAIPETERNHDRA